MGAPLVSVIVCVRDGARHLGSALDSIAAQGLTDLETIVVDDGSNDASAQIASNHRLCPQVVRQEPLGQSAALNQGMCIARGRYLAFLDHDDVWPPGRLDIMLGTLERDSAIDCVFGKVVNTDEDLIRIGVPVPARLTGAIVIRRAAALKVGEFRSDVRHGAILDWNGRAAGLELRFEALDDVVLLRRIHGGNMGIRDRANARGDLLRVVRDHVIRKRQ